MYKPIEKPEAPEVDVASKSEVAISDSLRNSLENNEPDVVDVHSYYGSDFNYDFGDWSDIINKYTYELVNKTSYNYTITDFLRSSKSNMIDDALRAMSITQAMSNIDALEHEYSSLSSVIKNFNAYDVGGALNSVDNMLTNAEELTENFQRLSEFGENIIDFVLSASDSESTLGSLDNFMSNKLNQFNTVISSITNLDISNIMSTFPSQVADQLMGTEVVQNLFEAPKRITNILGQAANVTMAMKAPTNLQSAVTLMKQMKSVVGLLKQVSAVVENTSNRLQYLDDRIKNGQFLGTISEIAGGLSFIEKPSEYNTVYPYNTAYVTEGNHLFEVDNTPNAERLKVQHKTGTTVEVQPDGSVVAKTKKDIQLIVDRNGEVRVVGDLRLTIDGKTNVYTKGNTTVESDTNVVVNAPEILAVSDGPVSIVGKDVVVTAGNSATVNSVGEMSLSSVQPMYITSNTSINMDAPIMNIGFADTQTINVTSKAAITEIAGTAHTTTAGGKITEIAPAIMMN